MRERQGRRRQARLPLAAPRRAGGGDPRRRAHRRPRPVRQHGYTATTVAEIAGRARVSLDTVYATVGRKPALLRELVETAISGTGRPVAAEQRDYVIRIGAADTARDKMTIYAEAIAAYSNGWHRSSWRCAMRR